MRHTFIKSLIELKVEEQSPVGYGSLKMPSMQQVIFSGKGSSEQVCQSGLVRLNYEPGINLQSL